ncbi:MAG TPA: hypothetical protein VJ954_09200 [Ignavibacteriaceae bacterium]|nr:hypothetical protein [Ignavibacteriaceae bacterium]
MDIYLALYIGVFLKWVFSGFKNKFKDELYGEGNHIHIYKKISLDTENTIIGLLFVGVFVVIIVLLISCRN